MQAAATSYEQEIYSTMNVVPPLGRWEAYTMISLQYYLEPVERASESVDYYQIGTILQQYSTTVDDTAYCTHAK